MRSFLLVGVLLLALGGCRKPKHSLEYTEASGKYTSLLAELGDDAYADSEMTRIEELLKRVPADSLDANGAATLLGAIASERRRVAQEAAAKGKGAAGPPVVFDAPTRASEPEAMNDAGLGGELEPGMTVDQIRKASDSCFAATGPLKLRNPDRSEAVAEMYERVDALRCRDRYARYEGRFLVIRDGKLVGDFARSALTTLVAPGQEQPPKPVTPAAEPQAPVEPGGDKPPTPLPPPDSPGEQTGAAPAQ
jgi:hypothetical protein